MINIVRMTRALAEYGFTAPTIYIPKQDYEDSTINISALIYIQVPHNIEDYGYTLWFIDGDDHRNNECMAEFQDPHKMAKHLYSLIGGQ